MKTEVLKIDINNIDSQKIEYAAQVIKAGGLVAFPTETVYGLGANALDEKAVSNIFDAKGRPADNPLIVHIAEKSEVRRLVSDIPANALPLMDKFWPGPLTMVMKKSGEIPSIVTAGMDTVAIRMPAHPIALALIRQSGLPIAAPSANTSGRPSPTEASHVIDDLSSKVDIIIDAGHAKVGLESTVLDVLSDPPVILRPGGVTPVQLEELLGKVDIDPAVMAKADGDLKPRSPGMKYTHYSPKADVIIVEGKLEKVVRRINGLLTELEAKNIKAGVLATEQTRNLYNTAEIVCMGDRDKPETIAANLFRSLREFDGMGAQVILAEAVDNAGIGLAVMNRMSKAAGYNIIKAD